ncbi:hypothetical protein F5B21DRAFT_497690 [Xylaria acuta]|nr:hypothetical protein F5B21DRAFT_497690 [Xylaria acuta]
MERFSTASCCLASTSNVAVMVISPLSIAAMEAGVPDSLFYPPGWRDRPLFVLYLVMGALIQVSVALIQDRSQIVL